MAVIRPVKESSTEKIPCQGSFQMTIGLTAVPDDAAQPLHLVLLLDCSGSMQGCGRMESMKEGAKAQLDRLCAVSGGVRGQSLGGGSRAGIVSYAGEAVVEVPLTDDVQKLKEAVDGLRPGGTTNHTAAFQAAQKLLASSAEARPVILLFTDGAGSDGGDPLPVTEEIRASGTEIFCIGLGGMECALHAWASKPAAEHVVWSNDPAVLPALFEKMGRMVMRPGAVNIRLEDVLEPDFRILALGAPSTGVAEQLDARSLRWTMEVLGDTAEETASLVLTVGHTGPGTGLLPVNRTLSYTDAFGQTLEFPQPSVRVSCTPDPAVSEPCPEPVSFQLDGCQDSTVMDLGRVPLQGLCRMVELNAVIRQVCPGKRVAAAVQLTEVGEDGREYPRGLKGFTLPAHHENGCADLEIRCIRFVLPEDVGVSGEPGSLCAGRQLRARVMANYLDTDFLCCDAGQGK